MKKQLLTSLFAFLLVFSLCMGCSKAETGDKTTASDSFEVSSQKTSPVKITLNEVALLFSSIHYMWRLRKDTSKMKTSTSHLSPDLEPIKQ